MVNSYKFLYHAANIPIFTLKKIEIMQKIRITLLFCFLGQFVFAQTVQVQVDILAKRKKVSPYIYGRNNSLSNFNNTPLTVTQWQFLRYAGVTMFRESGGNNSTKYNWWRKLSSHPEWYNNVYANNWDQSELALQTNMPNAQGSVTARQITN